MADVPITHNGHEPAPPPEADPVIQEETKGHEESDD